MEPKWTYLHNGSSSLYVNLYALIPDINITFGIEFKLYP